MAVEAARRRAHRAAEGRAGCDPGEDRRSAAKLRDITVELIEARAWSNQLRKAAKYRQPLIGWLDTQRRLGAKTGEKTRVAELVAESRSLMSECQAAVPVWIMLW